MCARPWLVGISVAGGDLDVPHALLALHVAAPVELTPAPLRPPLSPSRVAPVAAQQVATVDSLGTLEEKYFVKNWDQKIF